VGNLLSIEKKFTNILLLLTDLIIFLRKIARIPEILFYFCEYALRSYLNVLFNVVVRRQWSSIRQRYFTRFKIGTLRGQRKRKRDGKRETWVSRLLFISLVLRRIRLLWHLFLFPLVTFFPSFIAVFSSIFYSNFHGERKCGVSMEFDEAHSKHRRYTVIVFH